MSVNEHKARCLITGQCGRFTHFSQRVVLTDQLLRFFIMSLRSLKLHFCSL